MIPTSAMVGAFVGGLRDLIENRPTQLFFVHSNASSRTCDNNTHYMHHAVFVLHDDLSSVSSISELLRVCSRSTQFVCVFPNVVYCFNAVPFMDHTRRSHCWFHRGLLSARLVRG